MKKIALGLKPLIFPKELLPFNRWLIIFTKLEHNFTIFLSRGQISANFLL